MKLLLQYKFLLGYVILLAVIGCMVAVLVHERKRIREIKAETTNINLVRRGINTACCMTGFATLGECVASLDKADYQYCHKCRLDRGTTHLFDSPERYQAGQFGQHQILSRPVEHTESRAGFGIQKLRDTPVLDELREYAGYGTSRPRNRIEENQTTGI